MRPRLPTKFACQLLRSISLRSSAVRKMGSLPSEYKDPVHIAVIGGTGISHLPDFKAVASLNVETPWGSPSSPITILHHPANSPTPTPIAFLSRHGLHHSLAPHEVPSRANIAALRSIGVRSIVAFSAVGSLQEDVKPRDFLVPDQIIDRTKGVRPFTFFEGGLVAHASFGDPFDDSLGAVIRKVGGKDLEGEAVILHEEGLLICMEGPQFSTRAESNLYRSWGGSVINMSALPEAKLAREAEISYQMICMATDYDSWHATNESVTVEMVMGHMKANAGNARIFVSAVLDELSKPEHADLVQAKHFEGSMKMMSGITAKEGRGEEALKKLRWLFPGYFHD